MGMKVSDKGNYYVVGKNVVLVFKEKDMGYVIVVLERERDNLLGYAYVSYSDMRKLVEYVEKKYKLRHSI